MEKVARKYAPEAAQIAAHLEASDLKSTLQNVKEWVYRNFQYKEDERLQKICTLGYAYHHDRKSGIDCKSYSVIISEPLILAGLWLWITSPRTKPESRTAPAPPQRSRRGCTLLQKKCQK